MAAPGLSDFRARFPEFSDIDDADIEANIASALIFIDPTEWTDNDFKQAVLLFAAHLLSVQGTRAAAQALGGPGDSTLFVRSVAFGERHVLFGERRGDGSTQASIMGPGEAQLSMSIYGQLYQMLVARNFPPIMVF